MPTVEVKVPQLSESVTEVTLLDWKKREGEAVGQDEIIIELETDKVVLEVPATSPGTVVKLISQTGDTVHAGDAIAVIETGTDAGSQRQTLTLKPKTQAETASQVATDTASSTNYTQQHEFDVVVVGSGPGGYIAAIRAAQLGQRVACVERWRNPVGKNKLGGTCLNMGCIPSKALLASSEHFENARHHLSGHGIYVDNVRVELGEMIARKEAIVEKITGGVEFLFRKNKIEWFRGHGKFAGKAGDRIRVEVLTGNGPSLLTAPNVIIATGSKARHPEGVTVDNKIVVDNEGALSFDAVPARLAVVGAGVIGLELGSVWRRLGSEVTILEALPEFLGATDAAIAAEAAKQFRKQGQSIQLGANIQTVTTGEDSVTVTYLDKGGSEQTLHADRLIACIGRVPVTDNLGLESVGLQTDERGFIPVDDYCRTQTAGIYAIGDVVRGPMLAHKAEDEGVMVAEIIDCQKPHIDYNCIPWVIYTDPEIAWVGRTQQQLRAEGRAIKTGQFPMMANGRAMGIGKAAGFIKMIADAQTDEILGVHIISADASDLIAEAVLAMEFRAASEDIGMIAHPHPSLSEVMREAALAVRGRALNI